MNNLAEAKWVLFVEAGRSKSGITRLLHVISKESGVHLGEVKWCGPWRKYVFLPEQRTLFEQDCLRDIAAFLEATTRHHRSRATAKREEREA